MIDFSYTMPSGINAGKSVKDVFWKQVNKNGPTPVDKRLGECWVWTGKKFRNGYGCFPYKGKYLLAHRVSWELATGYIGTLFILHRCDNPECVRHDHHFEGTAKDNSVDKIQKGRAGAPRGELSGMAKLKEEDVKNIRIAYPRQTMKELGLLYKVSSKQISVIISRKQWSHI